MVGRTVRAEKNGEYFPDVWNSYRYMTQTHTRTKCLPAALAASTQQELAQYWI